MSSVFYDFLGCILHNKKPFISVIWLFSPSVEFGIIKVLGLAKRADPALTPHGYGAQLAGPDITDDTSELQLSVIFTVRCDKVNCLLGQEKVPWGTTSAHRL